MNNRYFFLHAARLPLPRYTNYPPAWNAARQCLSWLAISADIDCRAAAPPSGDAPTASNRKVAGRLMKRATPPINYAYFCSMPFWLPRLAREFCRPAEKILPGSGHSGLALLERLPLPRRGPSAAKWKHSHRASQRADHTIARFRHASLSYSHAHRFRDADI